MENPSYGSIREPKVNLHYGHRVPEDLFAMKLTSLHLNLPQHTEEKKKGKPNNDKVKIRNESNIPGWLSFRLISDGYVNLATTGKLKILIEDIDPDQRTFYTKTGENVLNLESDFFIPEDGAIITSPDGTGFLVRVRNMKYSENDNLTHLDTFPPRRIVIYPTRDIQPFSVEVEGNADYFPTHMPCLLGLYPMRDEPMVNYEECFTKEGPVFSRIFKNSRMMQSPLKAWSLERLFDITIDESDCGWPITGSQTTTLKLIGRSRVELAEEGIITLKQEKGASAVIHCKMGTFDALRNALQIPIRPHALDYFDAPIRLVSKSDGKHLTVEQRHIFKSSRVFTGVEEWLFKEGSFTMPYFSSQQVFIGGEFGIQVGETTSKRVDKKPHIRQAARIQPGIGRIYPIFESWGYFCIDERMARSRDFSPYCEGHGVSFYYQEAESDRWMVLGNLNISVIKWPAYKETLYDKPVVRFVAGTSIESFLDDARRNNQFKPLKFQAP